MAHAPSSTVPEITTCPTCQEDLEPIASDGDPPVQTVTQSCPSCEYEVDLGLLWYTTSNYEVTGKISATDPLPCARCGDDGEFAVVNVQRGVPRYYCDTCLPGHNQSSIG